MQVYDVNSYLETFLFYFIIMEKNKHKMYSSTLFIFICLFNIIFSFRLRIKIVG